MPSQNFIHPAFNPIPNPGAHFPIDWSCVFPFEVDRVFASYPLPFTFLLCSVISISEDLQPLGLLHLVFVCSGVPCFISNCYVGLLGSCWLGFSPFCLACSLGLDFLSSSFSFLIILLCFNSLLCTLYLSFSLTHYINEEACFCFFLKIVTRLILQEPFCSVFEIFFKPDF